MELVRAPGEMETRFAYVRRIESEFTDREEQLGRLRAEARALRLQRAELRSGAYAPQPLVELTSSDAVIAVLQQDGGAPSPHQSHERLLKADRDAYCSPGGTLHELEPRGRGERVGCGRWVIADSAWLP